MNKEKDFFKTCFNTVAGIEVKNESQAIAKEVILDEVENLTKENKRLKEVIEEVREYIEDWLFDAGGNGASMNYEDINELLQILDKVKN